MQNLAPNNHGCQLKKSTFIPGYVDLVTAGTNMTTSLGDVPNWTHVYGVYQLHNGFLFQFEQSPYVSAHKLMVKSKIITQKKAAKEMYVKKQLCLNVCTSNKQVKLKV